MYANCFSGDTLFLRYTSSGCFSYSFTLQNINTEPHADMTFERLGSTIGFRPQLSNSTSFSWNFGDGTTSTLQYPMKTYGPGIFTARLIATNAACNFKDTATQKFEIAGVEYYTPTKTGLGGDINMQIFGAALDSNTIVKLIRGNETIIPIDKFTNSIRNQLTAIFNLHLVTPGLYDVFIQVPGEEPKLYTGGLLVDTFAYPVTWAEVQGPARWRTNLDTRFNLVVGNNGNVMASGVVVGLAWPDNVSLTWEDKFIKPPKTWHS